MLPAPPHAHQSLAQVCPGGGVWEMQILFSGEEGFREAALTGKGD